MNDDLNKLILEAAPSQEKTLNLIGRLLEVAQPGTLFSAPVTRGEHTVIIASEAMVGMGAGYGGGAGFDLAEAQAEEAGSGYGGGGGGGGFSMGRPAAAIVVGPEGVRVDPIVDVTKITIAFFTTFAAMVLTLMRIRRQQQELNGR